MRLSVLQERVHMNGGLLAAMDDALPKYRQAGGPNDPYEWGNPTTWTKSQYPSLFGALKKDISYPQKQTGETQIYFRNGKLSDQSIPNNDGLYLGAYFILTYAQQGHWCNYHSCVAP